MFLEKFIKILDAPNKLIFSLFFIILITFSDKSPDGLLPIAHLGYYNRSSPGLDPNTSWYTE
jgi:hypothetical protein